MTKLALVSMLGIVIAGAALLHSVWHRQQPSGHVHIITKGPSVSDRWQPYTISKNGGGTARPYYQINPDANND